MAKSMTGFGIGNFNDDTYNVSIELKTINHKYLDINVRMPRKISFLEENLRQEIKKHLNRGRVDVFVKFEVLNSSAVNLSYDEDLAKQYYNILKSIKSSFNLDTDISPVEISKFPDVVKVCEEEDDEEKLWNILKNTLEISLEKLCSMRVLEGEKLAEDIIERTETLKKLIVEIEQYSDTVSVDYKNKLNQRISELLEDQSAVDEYRLAQEVAILADKASITEEIVRFNSHINQIISTLKSEDFIGRKMDFIIQEMNREVNTIGSKSSNLDITNRVILIKAELEKIREQVQNIE